MGCVCDGLCTRWVVRASCGLRRLCGQAVRGCEALFVRMRRETCCTHCSCRLLPRFPEQLSQQLVHLRGARGADEVPARCRGACNQVHRLMRRLRAGANSQLRPVPSTWYALFSCAEAIKWSKSPSAPDSGRAETALSKSLRQSSHPSAAIEVASGAKGRLECAGGRERARLGGGPVHVSRKEVVDQSRET